MRSRWLAAALAAGLCGLSGGVAAEQVKLTFMNALDSTTANIETDLIPIFEAEHPGVKVEFINVTLGEFVPKLLAMAASGVAPDVVMVAAQGHLFTLYDAKVLMPLTSFIRNDSSVNWQDILPSLRTAYTVDGEIMAIPYQYAPVSLMFYNKTHWQEAGLPDPPLDWPFSRFLDEVKKLTRRSGDQVQRYGTHTYHPLNWMYSWGGSLFDDWRRPRAVTFDAEPARAGLQVYVDLFTTHGVAPLPAQQRAWGGNYQTWFAEGKISSVYTGLWAAWAFGPANFEWDVTLPPRGEGGTGRGYQLAARGYGVTAGTRNPRLAYELARFLAYDPRAIRMRVLSGTQAGVQGEMPARLSLARGDMFATNSLRPRNKRLLIEADPYLFFSALHKNAERISGLVSQAASRAIAGQAPLATALAEARQQAEALLKE